MELLRWKERFLVPLAVGDHLVGRALCVWLKAKRRRCQDELGSEVSIENRVEFWEIDGFERKWESVMKGMVIWEKRVVWWKWILMQGRSREGADIVGRRFRENRGVDDGGERTSVNVRSHGNCK